MYASTLFVHYVHDLLKFGKMLGIDISAGVVLRDGPIFHASKPA
jgi:hypothetical protein